jgi:hypothetical protein
MWCPSAPNSASDSCFAKVAIPCDDGLSHPANASGLRSFGRLTPYKRSPSVFGEAADIRRYRGAHCPAESRGRHLTLAASKRPSNPPTSPYT